MGKSIGGKVMMIKVQSWPGNEQQWEDEKEKAKREDKEINKDTKGKNSGGGGEERRLCETEMLLEMSALILILVLNCSSRGDG